MHNTYSSASNSIAMLPCTVHNYMFTSSPLQRTQTYACCISYPRLLSVVPRFLLHVNIPCLSVYPCILAYHITTNSNCRLFSVSMYTRTAAYDVLASSASRRASSGAPASRYAAERLESRWATASPSGVKARVCASVRASVRASGASVLRANKLSSLQRRLALEISCLQERLTLKIALSSFLHRAALHQDHMMTS
jgi:hypothetical protein